MMFECECAGCYDSATTSVVFTDHYEADICDNCLKYLTTNNLVISAKQFQTN